MAFAVIDKLVKNYGSNCAVDNLSFKVNEGEIFGLIGPNGAGKSTTINIITTLDEMTSGSVTIDGMDISKDREKIRRIIGSVPQEIAVYPYLTAKENVEFFASLYGLKGQKLKESAEKALEFADLTGSETVMDIRLTLSRRRCQAA